MINASNETIFSGIIEKDNIKDYVQNRDQLVKKGRGAAFREAIKQMDEFISDPNV